LELSKFAHHLLVEEFPLSRHQIRVVKGRVVYEGRVRAYAGVGRFICGLFTEIIIISPKGLKAYVYDKLDKELE